MDLTIGGVFFSLLCEKAIYRADRRILILSDLHLGKAAHFRKAGIYMPPDSALKDYARFRLLMHKVQPEQVYILGDLFHSTHNNEWDLFEATIRSFPDVKFVLVLGNHDILMHHHYEALNITLVKKTLREDKIIYSHAPMDDLPEGCINIAGHIHPGVRLLGIADQSVTLPCFYLSNDCLLLPAFGYLTGLKVLKKERTARVFAVTDSKVLEV